MSPDIQPPSLAASRSLKSFVQALDNYDPEDFLAESLDGNKVIEPESAVKYLRCIRGFLTSARARIIEAQLPTVKEQLAILAGPIQQMNDHIFLLERGGKQTPEEVRLFLAEKMNSLHQWREQIASLALALESAN
jgi:hypothetical protein